MQSPRLTQDVRCDLGQTTSDLSSRLFSSASCKDGSLEPGGQQGRQSPPSIRAEPLVADAKGGQRGVEQPSGVWGWADSAVVWSLPQLYLESGGLCPSGSF